MAQGLLPRFYARGGCAALPSRPIKELGVAEGPFRPTAQNKYKLNLYRAEIRQELTPLLVRVAKN
jgi:hypothetical protein